MKENNTIMKHLLKDNWERYRANITLSFREISALVACVCSDSIRGVSLLSGGCANTNYKIEFTHEPPLVVRLYTRDALALRRERDIHQRTKGIPLAKMLYADESMQQVPYAFAVWSYVDGILLRDLIFKGENEAILQGYFEAGRYLSALSSMRFDEGGFFEDGLRIRPFAKKQAYLDFALSLLKVPTLKRDLGQGLVREIHKLVLNAQELLPSNTGANLTHGDFDPSNIKVKIHDGLWKISGILDWEFAFAGTFYSDIGQMIRYSHKLPISFEAAFINGIGEGGLELPPSWKQRAKLMDLLSLLKLGASNPHRVRPRLNSDVKELIETTVECWESFLGN